MIDVRQATSFWGTLENGVLNYDLPLYGASSVNGEMDWEQKEDGSILITHLAIDEDERQYMVVYEWK